MQRLRSWSFWLLGAITLGILQSQPEISAAIAEGALDYTEYAGPLWIKGLKDVFVVALWIYLVSALRDPFPASVRRPIMLCYAITAAAAVLSAVTFGPLLSLAGVRWILPLFVVLELRRLSGVRVNPRAITLLLLGLMAIAVGLQILRTFYFPPIWGERWGLSARPPAYFLLPNTNAFFAALAAAIVVDLNGRKHRWSIVALVLATVSAALSQSGGGVLSCGVLWLYMLIGRIWLVLPLIALVGSLFLSVAPSLLGREDFVDVSGGERLDKLSVAAKELTGPGAFGAYTNAGFMLIMTSATTAAGEREAIISDSFYVSVIGNFGLLAFPFFVALVIGLRRAEKYSLRWMRRPLGHATLLCVTLFGFSTVVSEVFPMIIMFGAGLWMKSGAATVAVPSRQTRIQPNPVHE